MILRLRIDGMRSPHCVQAIFTALTPVEGIRYAQVDIGLVQIHHDGAVTLEAVRDAIAVAGYEIAEASEDSRTLPVL